MMAMKGALPGEAYKAYVSVIAEHRVDGLMLPRIIVWETGLKYEVDRVVDIRPGYAAKAGGQGDRYTIMVNGKRTYLYFERSANLSGNIIGRWFVERKVPLDCSKAASGSQSMWSGEGDDRP